MASLRHRGAEASLIAAGCSSTVYSLDGGLGASEKGKRYAGQRMLRVDRIRSQLSDDGYSVHRESGGWANSGRRLGWRDPRVESQRDAVAPHGQPTLRSSTWTGIFVFGFNQAIEPMLRGPTARARRLLSAEDPASRVGPPVGRGGPCAWTRRSRGWSPGCRRAQGLTVVHGARETCGRRHSLTRRGREGRLLFPPVSLTVGPCVYLAHHRIRDQDGTGEQAGPTEPQEQKPTAYTESSDCWPT